MAEGQMNNQVGLEHSSEGLAHAQGAAIKMAQVRIVVAKDSTPAMTWERGMNVLSVYELTSVERIALHIALGVEQVLGSLMK